MTAHRPYLLQHCHQEHSKLTSATLARNIFQDEQAQTLSENELKTCKSYELVGRNELESLRQRARKRTKVTVRLETHCEEAHPDRKVLPGLLSKKEVLGLLPKIIREKNDGL